jgi:hypothetical protein
VIADGIDAVIKKVRQNIKYGADVIKVMATGGVVTEGDNPAAAQYSPEELKAIVDTAHALGRKVAAQAHATVGIKNAILAGVDSVEHGSYIDDEGIQLMKEHGTLSVSNNTQRSITPRQGSHRSFRVAFAIGAIWWVVISVIATAHNRSHRPGVIAGELLVPSVIASIIAGYAGRLTRSGRRWLVVILGLIITALALYA